MFRDKLSKTTPEPLHGTVVIAIDGPAGAGKSTAAKLLAERLGFFLLDTGALYRVMALHLIRNGIVPDSQDIPESALESLDLRIEPEIASMRLFLGPEEVTQMIRDEWLGMQASRFSTRPEVRRALLGLQRAAGSRWDLVAEGRDMGTVVFPDASVKFFVTADLVERSKRRHLEILQRGNSTPLDQVREEMRARDHRDESRDHSPLVQARDAIVIDTTHLTPQQVLERMLQDIEAKSVLRGRSAPS
ncbi:MAG: (d)CMP kinase [Desulfomonile tiedjei]|nr:(d)CMP kinase [Desulfomonile tiedjei]